MKVPKSIGIIMDGNRRFAKSLMKKPYEGHNFGAKKVREVLEWASDAGIREIILYALSVENINSRPENELNKIYEYLERELDDILSGNHKVEERKIKVRFIGRIQKLPEKIQLKIKEVEDKTKNYSNHLLTVAIAYGGRQEIVDAFKKTVEIVKRGDIESSQIDSNFICDNLYIKSNPDLIIRTGGERRLSNFLLWQAAYSELAFVDEKWPEFSKDSFMKILKNYNKRERRFGR